MAFIDGTVINVATAKLQISFSATAAEIQWVVEAYALTLSALLLLGGRLGDLYGHKRVFILGNILFAASSLFCAISGSLSELVAARATQGVAAAMLVPCSLTLITSTYPAEVRARAIGIWSGSTALMAAIGPFLGGWLIDHLSWTTVFYVNLPLATIATVYASRVPGGHTSTDRGTLNWTSSISMTAAFAALTYSLLSAQNAPIHAIPAAIASVGFFMLLIRCERRAATPLFPTTLLRSPGFLAANTITLFLYTATSAVFYFLPLNLIQIHHYAASEAGAALAPMILMLSVLSYWGGGLLARFGARRSLTVGSSIVSVAFFSMCLPGSEGSYWSTYFIPMLVFGLGMSICVAPLTTTVMNSAPGHLTGAASGINNAISRAAGLLAIAVFGLVLSKSFNSELDSSLQTLKLSGAEQVEVDHQRPLLAGARYANPAIQRASDASFVASFRLVIFMSAGLALVSAICAWSMLERDPSSKR